MPTIDFIKSYKELKKGVIHVRPANELSDIHKALGSPSDRYNTVHVAGTNGKGTVSLNISKGLETNGFKTGLLSSPHFQCETERISINGINISRQRLDEIYEENKEVLKGLIFFELLTFIALIYFAEQNVDYAVIEVGLGGLRDATNVIHPKLSVITNISNDHVEFLGPTLADIAYNKAGIIKQGTPVVLGCNAQHEECYKRAKIMNAKVYPIDSFHSDFLAENKCIADRSLEILGMNPLKEVYKPIARFEVHGNVIFDMAHNEDAFLALKRKIQNQFPGKKVIALWNMSTSKSLENCLEILRSFCEEVYFYYHDFNWLLTREDALKLGLKEYSGESSDLILVCGSVYFLADAKKKLLTAPQLQLQ